MTIYSCADCRAEFLHLVDLMDHACHNPKTVGCPYCSWSIPVTDTESALQVTEVHARSCERA